MRLWFHKAVAVGVLCFCGPVFSAPSGEDIYKQTIASIGAYDDPELKAYLDGLMREIVSVSEMSGDKFTFTLLDSAEINAFATADNYVYMNRGLLNYMANEAQLVSVLAHEVAHVTQRHVNALPKAASGAKFLTWLAAALSGSNEVYEAGMAYANSLIKGHGRENELEADRTAARYMVDLGYDPDEMLEMLSIMKDLETLQKQRASKRGAPSGTYHGIFSTHPRNDMRLRSAVTKAEAGQAEVTRDSGEAVFRQMTDGLVWGENFKEKEQDPERYSEMSLRVRFDFPDGWTYEEDAQNRTVVGKPENADASLSMSVHQRTPQGPEEYLYNHLNVPQLINGEEIEPARLKGFTGILPGRGGAPDQRIAVVFYKLNAFLFTGTVDSQETFAINDMKFLESINTFRPITNREIAGQKPKVIKYVKATEATTFAALGEELKLDDIEVEDLRLINGYYPAGEPKPGEWIKIFLQEE